MFVLMIKEIRNHKLNETFAKAFESFDEAFNFTKNKLKEYGESKKSVFDGNGHIKQMDYYHSDVIKNILDCHDEDYQEEYFSCLKKINKLIENIVLDKTEKISSFNYENDCFKYSYKANVLNISVIDEVLYEINPFVKTNLLRKEEKHYYFYVNDSFRSNDIINEFYLDLIEC